ncbi:MAG: CinA family protein [Chloroflexi bacterium]|nr:CinA family protein [Chloroflexota bacterium]
MLNQNNDPLARAVHALLLAQKQTLALAESCTGGLITHRLTNLPGSSAYLIAAVIAYAYEAKVAALGVSWDTLHEYGAVSPQVAREMARGARERFSSSLGVAVTGIAGPGGSTPEKPVGLTYIALASPGDVIIERYVWQGDREQNKTQSADAVLQLLQRYLTKSNS